ncbi:MAG: LysR family transcriptional regulator [Rhodobacteraceae bacterium]|nr:LysR family transcriptional regulator [Paracoccaceae bacterium]
MKSDKQSNTGTVIVPNLRHLRIFTAVSIIGSQHAAARSEGLTQPAISQAITSVEALFGTVLFDRSKRGMHLNRAGVVVATRVKRMLALLQKMHARSGLGQQSVFDNRLTMSHLKTLVAVTSNKGFTAAARQLGLATPTVHRAARNLETVVNARLFERTAAGIEPTVLGEDLARFAGLALREIDAAFEDINDLHGVASGQISIGTMPLARSDILPDAIGDLCDLYSHASVAIQSAGYEALLRALRHAELDLIIGASRGVNLSADVTEIPLFEDSLSVFARAGHPLANVPNLSIKQLAEFPWIAPHTGTPTRTDFDRLFGKLDLPLGLISSSSLVVVRALLARSDRLTLLSRRRILFEEQQGLLVELDISLPSTARTICVTVRTDWQPTRLQRTFLDLLKVRPKKNL